jgi:hypothetical protein
VFLWSMFGDFLWRFANSQLEQLMWFFLGGNIKNKLEGRWVFWKFRSDKFAWNLVNYGDGFFWRWELLTFRVTVSSNKCQTKYDAGNWGDFALIFIFIWTRYIPENNSREEVWLVDFNYVVTIRAGNLGQISTLDCGTIEFMIALLLGGFG